AEEIERLQSEASEMGKAEYVLELELLDESGEVVAQSRGLYQLRRH
ncbi:MAG: thioesterase, partial [Pseudomonas sp.]